jgi:hypothetical protein
VTWPCALWLPGSAPAQSGQKSLKRSATNSVLAHRVLNVSMAEVMPIVALAHANFPGIVPSAPSPKCSV